MKILDYRSDTVTQPTLEMKQAMVEAPLGDDVYRDDPTAIALEQLVAEQTGKEAGLFVPSGTMSNQLAVMTHTKRGDEIILETDTHVFRYEVGAFAILSAVSVRQIPSVDGMMSLDDIKNAIRLDDIHFPRTSMLCLENPNTHGRVLPLSYMEDCRKLCDEKNLILHLDGARIYNAAVNLGVSVAEIAKYADTVSVCLSKCLCAPVGSVLCGSREFIEKARKNRKILGGGMRQAGVLAAAGIVAIKEMTKRLPEDHANAQLLAALLTGIDGVELSSPVDINMVFFNTEKTGKDDALLLEFLRKNDIIVSSGRTYHQWRFVTHHGIDEQDIRRTAEVMREAIDN